MRSELEEKDMKFSQLEKEVENLRFERKIQLKNGNIISEGMDSEDALNPIEEFDKFSDRTNFTNNKITFNNIGKDMESYAFESLQKKLKIQSSSE